MKTCPVCERQTTGLLCSACGYDASQNREQHPTLGSFPGKTKTVSSLREAWVLQTQDLIFCDSCGCSRFTLNRKTRSITCVACNTPLTEKKKSSLYPTLPSPTPPDNIEFRPCIPPEGCRVITAGIDYQGRCDVENWQNIVALATSNCHTVGLKNDGTVVATGCNDYKECETTTWTAITAIAASPFCTFGLKADGTVIHTGRFSHLNEVKSWRNLRSIISNRYYLTGLTEGNRILTTNSDWKAAEQWTNIIAIASTDSMLFGLCRDGTVAAVADYTPQPIRPDVKNWKNIVAIATGTHHIVGLRNDGTVVADGENVLNQCAVSSWQNIIAIAACDGATVGLRADGTVVCTSKDLDVSKWQNISAISVAFQNIVGLQLSEEQYAAQQRPKE